MTSSPLYRLQCQAILSSYDTIRYDTMYLRALKSWQNGQISLVHGTETKKNKEKLKTKTD